MEHRSRTSLRRAFSVALCPAWLLLSSSVSSAEDGVTRDNRARTESEAFVRGKMRGLFEPFATLQRYLDSEAMFRVEDHKAEIRQSLSALRAQFHLLEEIPQKYRDQLGFKMNIKLVTDMLADADARFQAGNSGYAWWRLRTLGHQCFSCHATYRVDVQFDPGSAEQLQLSPLGKARFLLATRQFDAAQQQLLEVLHSATDPFNATEALRSLLTITLRSGNSLETSIALLQQVKTEKSLPQEDQENIAHWLESLRSLLKDKSSSVRDLHHAEQLIRSGTQSSPESFLPYDPVRVLLGTGIIHQLVETQQLTPQQQPKALFLLGLGYNALPLFFVSDWAPLHLEQCIEEFAGSKEAQAAYRLYREIVLEDFSGSAGTDIPTDVKEHLEKLKMKAYSSPSYSSPQV